MKQFLLRATAIVAVLALGWWGLEIANAPAASPQRTDERATVAVAAPAAQPDVAPPIEREATSPPATASDQIVFTGRCVAASGTAPLAGVPIVVLRMPMSLGVTESDYTDAHFVARAESAADGTFVCSCERRDGVEYPVQVGSSGHVARMQSFGPFAAARQVDLGDVPLRNGIRVITKVVDMRGQPVAGLRVDASRHDADVRADTLFEKNISGRTGDDGRVAWRHALAPGRYFVSWWEMAATVPAERQGSRMEVAAAPDVQENVVVWPIEDDSQSIRGVVVDTAGAPVSQLDLGVLGGGTRGNARSWDGGTFRIPRVGPYDLADCGPVEFGLPNAPQGMELVGEPVCNWGDRDVRLVVRAAATLVVRAVDASTGEQVRDFEVACAARLGDGAQPAISWARPSTCERRPDGTVLRKLARTVHDVQVFPADPRFAPSTKLVWDPRDGEQLVVPLAPRRTATVRVTAADGAPIAGTEVWALQPIEAVAGTPAAAGWRTVPVPNTDHFDVDATTRWARKGIDDAPLGSARTDADGRAVVPVPVDADVLITALGPGHTPAAIVGRAYGDADIDLRVERGATIHVVFSPKELAARLGPPASRERFAALGTQEMGIRGARLLVLRVTGEDANHWETAATIDLDGSERCTCRGLGAGEYQLYLSNRMQSDSADGILVGRRLARLTLRDGEERTVAADLSALATGRLRGRVLVNGEPWPLGGGTVRSHAGTPGLGDMATVEFTTDASGVFDVELPAGAYAVRLYYRTAPGNTGYWDAAERHGVVAGATTDAVFTARFATTRVRVVDAGGQPAPGLTITMDCTAEPKGWQWWTTDPDGWITIELTHTVPFTLIVQNPHGPVRAGRRSSSSGDATLGPFQIPPTGDTAEFRAQLPEGWR